MLSCRIIVMNFIEKSLEFMKYETLQDIPCLSRVTLNSTRKVYKSVSKLFKFVSCSSLKIIKPTL